MNAQKIANSQHPHSLTHTLTEGSEGLAKFLITLTSPHSPYRGEVSEGRNGVKIEVNAQNFARSTGGTTQRNERAKFCR